MGWYLRKSVRMGPVRWNLSKSGIGMSVGVRGLRVGTGPRGAYIAGGRGGLYFRQRLGRAATPRQQVSRPQSSAPLPPLPLPPTPLAPSTAPVAPVQYLPETEVGDSTPASADALARYITTQRTHIPLFWWGVGMLAFVNLLILGVFWPLAILTIAASIVGAYYLKQWDRQRTHVVLHYDLDPEAQASFQRLCAGLQTLASNARLVRVDARQLHGDWKRNAGAMTALQHSPAAVLPPGNLRWLETNVPVWSLRWRQGHLALLFLPDRLLIEQGRRTAAVPYAQVQVAMTVSGFVESGAVPPDARILTYRWQFTNKDGGPDRRFKANRQLPVTEAAYISVQSAAGLSLMLQTSSRDKASAFVQSVRSFRPLVCAEPPLAASTAEPQNPTVRTVPTVPRASTDITAAAAAASAPPLKPQDAAQGLGFDAARGIANERGASLQSPQPSGNAPQLPPQQPQLPPQQPPLPPQPPQHVQHVQRPQESWQYPAPPTHAPPGYNQRDGLGQGYASREPAVSQAAQGAQAMSAARMPLAPVPLSLSPINPQPAYSVPATANVPRYNTPGGRVALMHGLIVGGILAPAGGVALTVSYTIIGIGAFKGTGAWSAAEIVGLLALLAWCMYALAHPLIAGFFAVQRTRLIRSGIGAGLIAGCLYAFPTAVATVIYADVYNPSTYGVVGDILYDALFVVLVTAIAIAAWLLPCTALAALGGFAAKLFTQSRQ